MEMMEGLQGFCPGSANVRTPTLKVKRCPDCGSEVEVFSTDVRVTCAKCGFVVYNDLQSCIQWCKHARECVGEELYDSLVEDKKRAEGKAKGKGGGK